jgi:hypothetical protein
MWFLAVPGPGPGRWTCFGLGGLLTQLPGAYPLLLGGEILPRPRLN